MHRNGPFVPRAGCSEEENNKEQNLPHDGQLARTLGVTVKTAWFAGYRIREAMQQGALAVPSGSSGGEVEADKTFIGRELGTSKKRPITDTAR